MTKGHNNLKHTHLSLN